MDIELPFIWKCPKVRSIWPNGKVAMPAQNNLYDRNSTPRPFNSADYAPARQALCRQKLAECRRAELAHRRRTRPLFAGAVEEWSDREPERPALISETETFSYRALADRINRYARWALSAGIEAGDTGRGARDAGGSARDMHIRTIRCAATPASRLL